MDVIAPDPRYIIERSGKPYVLWPGLADVAHRAGISTLITVPVQLPGPANGWLAVTKTVVSFADGRSFDAYGEASPGSAQGAMKEALIRLAETRSKSRAVRDACNVRAAGWDELTMSILEMWPDAGPPREVSPQVGAAWRQKAANLRARDDAAWAAKPTTLAQLVEQYGIARADEILHLRHTGLKADLAAIGRKDLLDWRDEKFDALAREAQWDRCVELRGYLDSPPPEPEPRPEEG